MSKFAISAAALLAIAGAAQADDSSITFDLSNYVLLGPSGIQFDAIAAGAGTVKRIDWNISSYSSLNGSWASELRLELVAPGATGNAQQLTGYPNAATSGITVGSGNAGTFVWGTSPGPTWNLGLPVDHNFAWANSTTAQTSAGSTNALDGAYGAGSWSLNLFDSYFDGADGTMEQGAFGQGSYVTVWFAPIPGPGAVALFGLAGLAGARRRRA